MASQSEAENLRVFVTIDDHYSAGNHSTITVEEKFRNPYHGAQAYKFTLGLHNNEWIPHYYQTKYYKLGSDKEHSKLYTTSSAITKDQISQSKRDNLNRHLNDSAWRHIYVHYLALTGTTLKQMCNNSRRWKELCKEPHKFLKFIPTFRKTEWGGKTDAKHLTLLGYNSVARRDLERKCSAFYALYEKTKSPNDHEEYKKASEDASYQQWQETAGLTFMHSHFPLWRQGVFEEIEWHEKKATQKRAWEKYKKELKEWNKAHNQWIQQRLAKRPVKIKKLLDQRELRKLRKRTKNN
jgi:hypothetical protein